MKKFLPIILVACIAGGLGVLAQYFMQREALNSPSTPNPGTAPTTIPTAQLNQPIPEITLPNIKGQHTTLPNDFPQKPLLINVWASWCGPCVEEMPELQRFAESQTSANAVQVVGLALDSAENVQAFLAHTPVSYPILLETPSATDASVVLGNAKGLLPYTVLINAQGVLLKQKLGPFKSGEIDTWVAEGLKPVTP